LRVSAVSPTPRAEVHGLVAAMDQHWWYRGRRVVTKGLVRRGGVQRGGLVLDFGCGTGHMGPVLAEFGEVIGVEAATDALEVGSYDAYSRVVVASDLTDPVVPVGPFELIALLDVLEHVEDDLAMLSELRRRLTPAGRIIVSVPLWPDLFGEGDRFAGHFRRYTPESFLALAANSGLSAIVSTGYVVALLPAARLQRRLVKVGAASATQELRVPWAPVNAALSALAMTEGFVGGRFGLPPGLSLVAILKRASTSRDSHGVQLGE